MCSWFHVDLCGVRVCGRVRKSTGSYYWFLFYLLLGSLPSQKNYLYPAKSIRTRAGRIQRDRWIQMDTIRKYPDTGRPDTKSQLDTINFFPSKSILVDLWWLKGSRRGHKPVWWISGGCSSGGRSLSPLDTYNAIEHLTSQYEVGQRERQERNIEQ